MKRIVLLDLLTRRFPETERKALHARVLCGEISVNGATERNPKQMVRQDADVAWKGSGYVGRGAVKLGAAIDAFDLQCERAVVLDAGSSTGGFTEALLERGANLVYAVDVGTNQLAWKLRSDTRVVVMEGTNIQHVTGEIFDQRPDFAVCDLSFRSLSGIAAYIASLTRLRRVIALAKPQFERSGFADRGTGVGDHSQQAEVCNQSNRVFTGVVSDSEGRQLVDALVVKLQSEGLVFRGIEPSPIRGHRGNREYFLDLEIGT